MANVLFAYPNFADADFYTPVLSGGSWLPALPLSNLQSDKLSKVARSSDAAAASTRLHADLALARDVRVVAVPRHNLSRSAQWRVRAVNQVAWSGVSLAAGASAGASSISVQCPSGVAMMRAGDSFTLAGDGQVYTLTSDLAMGGNRLAGSEDLSFAAFTPTAAAVTTNATTAPDGTLTADLLTEDGTNATHMISVSGSYPGVNSADPVAFSVFVKPVGARNLILQQYDVSDTAYAVFDLANVAVQSTVTSASAVVLDAGVVALPGGWFRCWIVAQRPGLPGVVNSFDAVLTDANFNYTYTGDGASGAYLWGFDIRTGSDKGIYAKAVPGDPYGHAYGVTSGTVTVTPNLAANHSTSDALTCLCGEYVSTPPLFDSLTADVFQVIYPFGSLPWGHPSLWDGRVAEEDRTNYPTPLLYDNGTAATARYLLLELADATNGDGYVELARLFAARGYQPTRNFRYDNELGWDDPSAVRASLGGADYVDERPRGRVFNLTVEHLPRDEALVNVFDMQKKLGRKGQIFVALDPADTDHRARLSMLATLADVVPLSNPHHDGFTAVLQLKEVTG